MKKNKHALLHLSLAVAAALLTMQASATVPGAARGPESAGHAAIEETDQLIVRYRDTDMTLKNPAAAAASQSHVIDTARRHGALARQLRVNGLGAQIWALDKRMKTTDVAALARAVAADPQVLYAEPDRLMYTTMTPNDTRYNEQWHYQNTNVGISAPGAWDMSTGAGIVVGVIDSGYRPHVDLVGNLLPGYDFVSNATSASDGNGRDADATDPGGVGCRSNWHGTHVAGTIAARTNNATGVAGVAHGARVLPLRALGCNTGYESDIADAIVWGSGGAVWGMAANTTPARVLNLSLGAPGSCSTTYSNAINSARNRGVVVVVAAGNDNVDYRQHTPANCPGVISVLATTQWGQRAWFSNFGSTVSIAAPGETILSTYNDGASYPGADTYYYQQGTSMAAPHVAGVAALIMAANPNVTGAVVESILKSTTKPFPYACANCGPGIVNAEAAVSKAYNMPTSISPDWLSKTRIGTGTVQVTAQAVPRGQAPFTYTWSTSGGSFNLSSTTGSSISISAYLEVCGSITYAEETGTVHLVVRDANGVITRADAGVSLRANKSNVITQCM